MEAWFRAQVLWRIICGVSKPPTVSATPKEGEVDKLEAWQLKADKAAGIMWWMVDNTQRVHFRGIKDDPVKMWGALKEVHMQKRPGTRFNAYDDLFSIRKHEEEDLQSLINQVDDALHRIRHLRSTAFTLDKLDDELAPMALIRALPENYNSFISSFAGNTRMPRTRLGRIETTGRKTSPTLLRLRKLRLNSLEMQVLPLHLHLPSLLTLIGLQTQGQLLI